MLTVKVLFYVFSLISIVSALMLVISNNPVRAVLSLVLTFFGGAGVWMTMQAEYLSLLLIVVYVGAVLIMFLFVIMMIDIEEEVKKSSFVTYLPLVLLLIAMVLIFLIWVFSKSGFGLAENVMSLKVVSADVSDIRDLGMLMFTEYLYPFELAGLILFSAMVAAIAITYRGQKSYKSILAGKQIKVKAKDRLEVISMKSEIKVSEEQKNKKNNGE